MAILQKKSHFIQIFVKIKIIFVLTLGFFILHTNFYWIVLFIFFLICCENIYYFDYSTCLKK